MCALRDLMVRRCALLLRDLPRSSKRRGCKAEDGVLAEGVLRYRCNGRLGKKEKWFFRLLGRAVRPGDSLGLALCYS